MLEKLLYEKTWQLPTAYYKNPLCGCTVNPNLLKLLWGGV